MITVRLFQGLFAGYFSNTHALLAAEVPKNKSGYALGTLAIGFTTGSMIGPLLGGTLGSLFGYRFTFLITGLLLVLVFMINAFSVRSVNFNSTKQMVSNCQTEGHDSALKKPIMILYITTLFIQLGANSISPIMPLYVAQIMRQTGNINFMNGLVASASGIACLMTSTVFGIIGDRMGTNRLLKIGLAATILFLVPMAFVTSIGQLIVLEFATGLSEAILLPAVNSLLAKNAPAALSSSIFGYNQSFQSVGIVIGPFLGSFTANTCGYRNIFLIAALLLVILLLIMKSVALLIKT